MKREDVKKQIPNITDEQLDWLMAKTAGISPPKRPKPPTCRSR